ncbi:bifunctional nicotinamidase/pyrazinamidase [Rhizobium sp. BK251]|uniref:bifunctional nicotinamidase/pyrazinamidase n=1 Tax=Rhizobium sp. BK251 TaxID=2512125 RepID=UPI00104D2454|nr:bifunctional nicotinamidase/pyrazinamidase [Rhizobium sp. BK251]TCL75017.1 nicotinamidase/pyrazinamidase [Rhizobium sp. BK251]
MKALLLIDIQNGFCPGGNLPVADGHAIVPIANALIDSGRYDLIVASQDWHPPGHGSFASMHPDKEPFEMGVLSGKPQMLWPDHCVRGTPDAELHPDLKVEEIDLIQLKGESHGVDSYSAFRDNDKDALTGLSQFMKDQGVTELDICGLATDYCVKFSALDAIEMLPEATIRVIEDASRGITPEGVSAAIEEMRENGIAIISSRDAIAA